MARKVKTLEEIVNEVIAEDPKALLEIQSGIRPSLDRLVKKVMRRTEVKVDPRKIRNLITSKL